MNITIEIPDALAKQFGNSPAVAGKELLKLALIERYREGVLTLGELAESLGLSRWDTEALLERHGGVQPYTMAMLDEDRRVLQELNSQP